MGGVRKWTERGPTESANWRSGMSMRQGTRQDGTDGAAAHASGQRATEIAAGTRVREHADLVQGGGDGMNGRDSMLRDAVAGRGCAERRGMAHAAGGKIRGLRSSTVTVPHLFVVGSPPPPAPADCVAGCGWRSGQRPCCAEGTGDRAPPPPPVRDLGGGRGRASEGRGALTTVTTDTTVPAGAAEGQGGRSAQRERRSVVRGRGGG